MHGENQTYHIVWHMVILLAHDPRDADLLLVGHVGAPVDVLRRRLVVVQLAHDVSVLVLNLGRQDY